MMVARAQPNALARNAGCLPPPGGGGGGGVAACLRAKTTAQVIVIHSVLMMPE
eukprot:COSAG01_NODE_3422_length_6115_cov_4.099402_4_plen_53_part_00